VVQACQYGVERSVRNQGWTVQGRLHEEAHGAGPPTAVAGVLQAPRRGTAPRLLLKRLQPGLNAATLRLGVRMNDLGVAESTRAEHELGKQPLQRCQQVRMRESTTPLHAQAVSVGAFDLPRRC
jgi:hypothetical protein